MRRWAGHCGGVGGQRRQPCWKITVSSKGPDGTCTTAQTHSEAAGKLFRAMLAPASAPAVQTVGDGARAVREGVRCRHRLDHQRQDALRQGRARGGRGGVAGLQRNLRVGGGVDDSSTGCAVPGPSWRTGCVESVLSPTRPSRWFNASGYTCPTTVTTCTNLRPPPHTHRKPNVPPSHLPQQQPVQLPHSCRILQVHGGPRRVHIAHALEQLLATPAWRGWCVW